MAKGAAARLALGTCGKPAAPPPRLLRAAPRSRSGGASQSSGSGSRRIRCTPSRRSRCDPDASLRAQQPTERTTSGCVAATALTRPPRTGKHESATCGSGGGRLQHVAGTIGATTGMESSGGPTRRATRSVRAPRQQRNRNDVSQYGQQRVRPTIEAAEPEPQRWSTPCRHPHAQMADAAGSRVRPPDADARATALGGKGTQLLSRRPRVAAASASTTSPLTSRMGPPSRSRHPGAASTCSGYAWINGTVHVAACRGRSLVPPRQTGSQLVLVLLYGRCNGLPTDTETASR